MKNNLTIAVLAAALTFAAAPSWAGPRDSVRFTSHQQAVRISTGSNVRVPAEVTALDGPKTLKCFLNSGCALSVQTDAQVASTGIAFYQICALADGVAVGPCNSFFTGEAHATLQTMLHLPLGAHTMQSQITATFGSGSTSGSIDNYQIVYTMYSS